MTHCQGQERQEASVSVEHAMSGGMAPAGGAGGTAGNAGDAIAAGLACERCF